MKNFLDFENHLKKLAITEEDEHDMEVFSKLYHQFRTFPATIDWTKMRLIDEKHEIDYAQLPPSNQQNQCLKSILDRLVVIKLNGGLGTTMGCKGPKSLIELREGLSFLDFALLQNQVHFCYIILLQFKKFNEKHQSNIPLYLMNSFNTDLDTKAALKQKPETLTKNVHCFKQSRCPRIFADTLMPVPTSSDDRLDDGWYPPGHGNIFQAMNNCDILNRLLSEGRDLCFISNIDNTGAQIDLLIANAMHNSIADYLMEGGTLIELDGRLMHLEMPQVPDDKIDEFCSVKTMFNTNNIWVNLKAVKARLQNISMEILANKKLSDGRACIQLETSIGGAIRNFENAISVRVSRKRFLPVKSTQELLALMSNCYFVDREDYGVKLSPGAHRPIVRLSARDFSSVPDFFSRFQAIPDMKECLTLNVDGDVKFGENVCLQGNVNIKVPDGQPQLFLSNQTVTNTEIPLTNANK